MPLLQIDIISQTKNARAVQPHLQKCFDGIQSLEFGEGTTIVDIHAMVSGRQCAAELSWSTALLAARASSWPSGLSAHLQLNLGTEEDGCTQPHHVCGKLHELAAGEGERVQLGKNLKARAPVETWLAAVESQMRMALKAAAKKALRDFHDVPQDEWITQQPAQMVLAVSSIVWCSQVGCCLHLAENMSCFVL